MNRWVALAPAYPPLSGDPFGFSAAPLRWMVPPPVLSVGSANAVAVRDTGTTGAPAAASAVAIPRPKPRLAPTTIVVLPDRPFTVSS
jgi:hypothetical protein